MIPVTDALPMTLRPGRVRTAVLLFTFVAFTVLGVVMGRDGEWLGYLIGGFFALGIPVFALQFHPRAAFLRLDEEGFTFCSLFRSHTVRWADVEGFGVINVGAGRMVAWNFVPGRPHTGRARRLSQAISGYEAALPDPYGLKPTELATLLDTLRQRWGDPPAVPFFDDAEIAQLLAGKPVRGPLPFDPADVRSLQRFYAGLVERIERERGLLARVDWNHYGSGYASFVEAWFYPPDGSARQSRRGEDHVGLVVLFSRLSRFFVLGEDEKTWSNDGSGSGCLPNFRSVDDITHPTIRPHVAPVTALLTAAGLQRLHRQDLAALLPEACPVPTILTDQPFRQFDALFHWED